MTIIKAAITAVVTIAILLVAAYGLGWFRVEAERTIVQNSRQYVETQQRHLVGLSADCAELDVKIAETDDETLIEAYERQQDSIDRQMQQVSNTLDPSDIPIGARSCP